MLIVCLASLLPCEDVVQYLVCRYVLVLMRGDSLAQLSIRSLMNGNRILRNHIFDIVEAHCYILYTEMTKAYVALISCNQLPLIDTAMNKLISSSTLHAGSSC